MRYDLMKKSLENLLPNLKLQITSNKAPNNTIKSYTVTNWLSVFESLYELQEFTFAKSDVAKIFNLGVNFRTSTKTIVSAPEQYKELTSTIDALQMKTSAIICVLAENEIEDVENQLNIKLPPLSSLDDLQKCIKNINIAFSQNSIFDEQIKLEFLSVRQGSDWILVAVSGATIINILKSVSEFIKACFDLKQTIAETKKSDFESALLKLELDEKTRQNLIQQKKEKDAEELQALCVEKVNHINPDKVASLSPEEKGRLAHAMKTLAELFNDGMEIYPSDEATEEIKKMFPAPIEYPKLTSAEKPLITDKKAGDETK